MAFVAALPQYVAAQDASRCADLPQVSATDVAVDRISIPGPRPDIPIPLARGAKDVYLRALCGVMPAEVMALIEEGTGAVLEIPRDLAASLDGAFPYMPTVRFMYVRGGGITRDAIVVLFADGYRGPFFRFDEQVPWTLISASSAEEPFNLLPYEFLRRATRRLHDVGRFRDNWFVDGGIRIIVPYPVSNQMANPVGTMFIPSKGEADREEDASTWVHELGHFLHYEIDGVNALAYAHGYTGIARRNRRFFGVEVPFRYKHRYSEMRDQRCQDLEIDVRPWGYTSNYGCEGIPTEDFADSMSAAMGATQFIVDNRTREYRRKHAPERLFTEDGTDAHIMRQRADWVRTNLNIDLFGPQDADGDGVMWERGVPGGDCDDRNPVIGYCDCETGETRSMPCGVRCGTRQETCELGQWSSSACLDEGVCRAGSSTFLRSEREGTMCGGESGLITYDVYATCTAECTEGPEVRETRDVITGSSPEICDGLDNDCDGSEDEGCPSRIQVAGGTPGLFIPSGVDDSYVTSRASCRGIYAMTGVEIQAYMDPDDGALVGRLRARCQEPLVVAEESMIPFSYSVGLGPVDPDLGGSALDSVDATLVCPPGTVVQAIHGDVLQGGRRGSWVSSLQLTCAPLTLGESERGAIILVRGAPTQTSTYLGSPMSRPNRSSCPGFASGIELRLDGDGLRGMRAMCNDASLSFR